MERASIFIDGSNFYHRLSEIGIKNLLDFDYSGFANWILKGKTLESKRYYIGQIRADREDKKAQELLRDQQRLFAKLQRERWVIEKGYMMKILSNKNGQSRYKEKGVDVKVAIDLLVGAYEDLYDTAILLSSDTDLLPAIKKVSELGKDVEYIGFEHSKSFGMLNNVQRTQLLRKKDLEPFSGTQKKLLK